METPDNSISSNALSDSALSDNEKLIAMFVHLSIFFGGLIIPPIFWLIYHDRSKFVVFHSVQSLFFHIIYTVGVLVICLGLGLIYYSTGLLDKHPHPTPGIPMLLFMLAFSLLSLAFIFGCMIYGIYMGINAYKGRFKKYPVIGNMIYKKIYETV